MQFLVICLQKIWEVCIGFRGISGFNLTVRDSCQLFLGPTGTIQQTNYIGEATIYTFEGLTVATGVKVTHIPGAPTEERNLTIVVRYSGVRWCIVALSKKKKQMRAHFDLYFI